MSTTTGDKQPHHPSEFAQDSKQNHDAQVQALLDEERTTRRPRPVHSQTNILARPPIKVERTGPQTHAAHTPNVTAPSPDWVHTSEVSISSRPSLDKDPTLSQLPWDHALSSVLPEIRMNGQGPSGQWFPLPPPPPPLAPPPALPINSCEVPRIDLKDACPCSLIGHSCPYPEGKPKAFELSSSFTSLPSLVQIPSPGFEAILTHPNSQNAASPQYASTGLRYLSPHSFFPLIFLSPPLLPSSQSGLWRAGIFNRSLNQYASDHTYQTLHPNRGTQQKALKLFFAIPSSSPLL